MRAILASLTLCLSTTAVAEDLLLNQATAEQFATVEGVDNALASRIVDLRDSRGGLNNVEALRVLNIDAGTLDNLRQDVVVDLPVLKVGKKEKSYASVAEVLAEFDGEPDVRAVQAMAMEYTRTNPALVEGWMNAATRAYLLPQVTLDYDKKLNLSDDYDFISIDGETEVTAELTGRGLDNDDAYGVQLKWQLYKIVMSSERIRVINEAQDIVKLRDKVLDEVTRLYFDRRRLQVEMLLSPSADLKTQMKDELRLQELSANIDAYTGGKFSEALARGAQ